MALIGAVFHPFGSQLEKILEAGISRADFTGDCQRVWIEIEKLFSGGVDVTPVKLYELFPNLAHFFANLISILF